MKSRVQSAMLATTAAVLLSFSPAARASVDESVQLTFRSPVEIPGYVLIPGTYVFESLQQGSLTRIRGVDGHFSATFITNSRERRDDERPETIVTKKGPAGAPERIDAWFWPGDSIGNEFIYSDRPSEPKKTSLLRKGERDAGQTLDWAGTFSEHIVVGSVKWSARLAFHGIRDVVKVV